MKKIIDNHTKELANNAINKYSNLIYKDDNSRVFKSIIDFKEKDDLINIIDDHILKLEKNMSKLRVNINRCTIFLNQVHCYEEISFYINCIIFSQISINNSRSIINNLKNIKSVNKISDIRKLIEKHIESFELNDKELAQIVEGEVLELIHNYLVLWLNSDEEFLIGNLDIYTKKILKEFRNDYKGVINLC